MIGKENARVRPSGTRSKQKPREGITRAGLEGSRRCGFAATTVSSY
jgi:hypothetical protein